MNCGGLILELVQVLSHYSRFSSGSEIGCRCCLGTPLAAICAGSWKPAGDFTRMARSGFREGPSPWVPVTILGVILVIIVLPFSRPEPAIAYQAPRQGGFALPLLWIPVLLIVLFQWMTGSRPELYGGRHYGASSREALGLAAGPPGYYNSRAGIGGPWSPVARSSWNEYHRQNNYSVGNLLWTSFMDVGGHWLLIFVGIMFFSMMVGSRTAYGAAGPTYATTPAFSFPWSLFFPWRPVVQLPAY